MKRPAVSPVFGSGLARLLAHLPLGAAGLGRFVVLAILSTSLMACSPETEREAQRAGEDPRQATAPTPDHASPTAESGDASTTDAPISWDYVALGDSLAVGVGARRGYVERYADHVASDTGSRVDVTNLGRSGQTSQELLDTLRDNRSVRRKLRAAHIVTFNIGINDLGRAGEAYENGACGGEENERCLRLAVERVKGNWDAIVAEIVGLRSTDDAIVRTAGLGYTPRVDEVFRPYLIEVNRHIAGTAADNDIPYAQPHLADGYMNPDGIHPNDAGYEVMAERLREPGYGPLHP